MWVCAYYMLLLSLRYIEYNNTMQFNTTKNGRVPFFKIRETNSYNGCGISNPTSYGKLDMLTLLSDCICASQLPLCGVTIMSGVEWSRHLDEMVGSALTHSIRKVCFFITFPGLGWASGIEVDAGRDTGFDSISPTICVRAGCS